MTTYYIYVANNSAKVQTFFLFNELPGMDGVTKAYSNVYAAGRPRQPDGSIQQFAVTTDAFAVCGYQQINKNVVISGTDNTPMNLDGTDPDEANIVVVDGGPGFVASTGGAQSGSFNITVKPYDEGTYPDVWCGYGKLGAIGDFGPAADDPNRSIRSTPGVKVVACWQADPSATYIVTPVVKFYIATGTFTKGETVTLTEIGDKVEIDFTDKGNKVYASLEMKSDGTYSTPTFSPTPPEVRSTKIKY
ncbi:hypothetical protein H2199_001964 [Coniosporium tulheliwenetii]|uniref:Uncharacterized protein n=1 Tax=Coniosporium tulheliwenetii TaxID=3383036 RepID=A0ACC2ZGZ8_9PEZI|nr:hypothetical protein H2199_001964 [Cladosporium sp. JES 115]